MCLSKNVSASGLEKVVAMYPVKVIAIIVLMLLYIFALRAFGFLFTTPVFLFASMLLFGERRWLQMVVISVVGSIVLYIFFVQLMSVRF